MEKLSDLQHWCRKGIQLLSLQIYFVYWIKVFFYLFVIVGKNESIFWFMDFELNFVYNFLVELRTSYSI